MEVKVIEPTEEVNDRIGVLLASLPIAVKDAIEEGWAGVCCGTVRSLVYNEPTRDIDICIFGSTLAERRKRLETLSTTCNAVRGLSADLTCIVEPGRPSIELFVARTKDPFEFFSTMEFDIAGGLYLGGLFYLPQAFENSLRQRTMRFQASWNPDDTLQRLVKYLLGGYRVTEQEVRLIVETLFLGFNNFENLDEYSCFR